MIETKGKCQKPAAIINVKIRVIKEIFNKERDRLKSRKIQKKQIGKTDRIK